MNGLDEPALTEIRETFAFLAPVFDKTLKLPPNPRAPKQRRMDTTNKAGRTDHDQPHREQPKEIMECLRILGQLALRHERSLSLLQSTDSFVLYFQQDQSGSLPGLLKETQKWQQLRQKGPGEVTQPLRQHLCLWLMKDLQTRVMKVSESKQGDELLQICLGRKIVLEDMSWPYLRWDPSTKALMIDKKKAVSMKKMLEHLEELCEDMLHPALIVRFQGLPMTSAQAAVPWKLQINMRHDRTYDLLVALAHNSVWMLAGTSLKLHQPKQSSLANALTQMMSGHKGQGKGSHKGKSKAKHTAT